MSLASILHASCCPKRDLVEPFLVLRHSDHFFSVCLTLLIKGVFMWQLFLYKAFSYPQSSVFITIIGTWRYSNLSNLPLANLVEGGNRCKRYGEGMTDGHSGKNVSAYPCMHAHVYPCALTQAYRYSMDMQSGLIFLRNEAEELDC